MGADRFCTDSVTQEAVGDIEAQHLVTSLRSDSLTVDHSWLGFIQLATKYGWRSPACRAYVLQLAKKAAE